MYRRTLRLLRLLLKVFTIRQGTPSSLATIFSACFVADAFVDQRSLVNSINPSAVLAAVGVFSRILIAFSFVKFRSLVKQIVPEFSA
jgi:hypothetical protein